MKFVITIFLLPYEIDDLERIVNQLKLGSYLLSGKNHWVLDVNLCLADDMVDWSRSTIPRDYFSDKLQVLAQRSDWCEARFTTDDAIKGCVSQRRHAWKSHPDADYFIWLDGDIIFSERTLTFFEQAGERLRDSNPMVILTPEIVRIWDSTWDCLVNENYLSKPLGYQKDNDPFRDAGVKGQVSLEEVVNTVQGQPRFKFAGGWFTCLSRPLLDRLGIPESLGHYGLEDTFIMWGAENLLIGKNQLIKQYKLKNIVVTENYKYRNYSPIASCVAILDRKTEFRKIAEQNFGEALSRIDVS